MKTSLDCLPCFVRQALEAARFVSDDPALHEQLARELLRSLAELDFAQSPPLVAQQLHRRLRALSGNPDPYRSAKDHANALALAALPALRAAVQDSAQPLLTATRLAVAANAIDMGIANALTDETLRAALQSAPEDEGTGQVPNRQEALLGDTEDYVEAVARAESILFLADNAGELVVDRLLVEQLGPARVVLATRGRPVLNDVTREDAITAGFAGLRELIDNGSDAPGTVLEDCSAVFRQRFAEAPLIIAKGQGNFETLSEVTLGAQQQLFFAFKVECPVIAKDVGLPLGSFALVRAKAAAQSRH
ncbi:MAG: ARMT1-like domain-containing protein [Myxococcota bacterium]|jgi:uncharacterized protein with ATP-grasp and redox domains|nr:ARMT1-like domain-containing protein [Myxococcota bacterium]